MPMIVPDAYDKLFCRCDGTTTSFVDSSTANPKTITANGNATQLSLASGVTSRTAGFFNGATDYVVVPDSADWDFGTGDFEIEFYVNFSTVPTGSTYLIYRNNGSNGNATGVLYNGTNLILYTMNSHNSAGGAWSPTKNTWYKITARRTGGNGTILVDDVQIGASNADTTNVTASTPFTIGSGYTMTLSPTAYMHGWLKNLTITKASTLVLDMRFDSPATSPLAPAIAFDGTGDSIYTADHNDWNLTDFTQEAFFYLTTVSATQGFWGNSGTTDANWMQLSWNNSTGNFEGRVSGTTTNWSYALTASRWYHIAMARSGSSVSLYVNGVLQSGTLSDGDALAPSNAIYLGLNDTSTLKGYAKEWRISNSARYASSFTPSQTGFPLSDANTVLYIKGNEDNGVTTFVDQTGKTVTTAGDTKIKYTEDYRSCIFKDETGKFPYPVGAKVDFFTVSGSGVGYFDGANGTYLSVADSADWDMTDFTIETYFRTGGTGNYNLIDFPSSQLALAFYGNNASYTFDGTVGATRVNQTSPVPPINTWTHYALVRSGTNAYCFKDGTLLGTVNVGTTATAPSALNIGSNGTWGSGFLGLLDNIRISKGVARYTASFNPPVDYPDPVTTSKINFLGMF
jgi:hypothetical protein